MTVGPEEWELISLLKTPKTVLEICRESLLGDFRSCQLLWALRLLDAVGEAPVEVSVDTALGVFDSQPAAAEPEATESAPEPEPAEAEPAAVAGLMEEAVAEPAPEPDFAPEPEARREPDPDPIPLPVSDADNGAEVISEPWRLAEQKHVDNGQETVAIPREEVEAALRGSDEDLPRVAMVEPEAGVRDMKVDDSKIDLRPDAPARDRDDVERDRESTDSGRAPRVPREELEAAMHVPEEAAELPPFEPPANFDGAIASFNARHVVLFRALRAEIGAGAANFVRSCRGTLDDGFAAMFEAADLRADGSWDPDGLKRAVIAHRVENAPEGFERLLNDELRRLRAHLGDARAAALANQLSTIR